MMRDLPVSTPAGKARLAALGAGAQLEATPTAVVTYQSYGRLAIIGSEPEARDALSRLGESLSCTVLVPGAGRPDPGTLEGASVVRGGQPTASGRLGRFSINLQTPDGTVSLAEAAGLEGEHFDLLLDLQPDPLLEHDVPPVGYYAPAGDAAALEKALSELPEMRGEFEKPKYFNFNPEICAHSRSSIQGCTRCLDACSTLAISSAGDVVQVDPYLCQGAGSCVAACPSGAMSYAYPAVSDLLQHLRGLLDAFRAAGGGHPGIVFHDAWAAMSLRERLEAELPEDLIPVEVEEIGSVGMDTWLAVLAYGARCVALCVTTGTPARMRRELQEQVEFARGILAGMGYDQGAIALVQCDGDDQATQAWAEMPGESACRPARFAAPDDKRQTLRLAIDHLFRHAPAPRKAVELPAGAPFGEVRVDKVACTLCMGCVSVCPVAALTAGGDLPQLRFTEWNCVQCGLCETACPEDAITLRPRLLFDAETRQQPRVLHEEPPFCCISCGKPFTTAGLLQKMERKLEGHWMFQTEEARRRLQMCEHCRVKDMFKSGREGSQVRS